MLMVNNIEYSDYDAIQDDIFSSFDGFFIKLNVKLYRTNSNRELVPFHTEFKRNTKINNEVNFRGIMIKRRFEPRLILGIQNKEYGTTQSIYLYYTHMIQIQSMFRTIIEYMINQNNWIATKDGKLKPKSPMPLTTPINNYSYITVSPIAYEYADGRVTQGMRITIGEESCFADCGIDEAYAIYYILQNFNLYEAGQNLINYLGRPEFGTNLTEFEGTREEVISAPTDIYVKPTKKRMSIFDQMNRN